MPKIVDREEMQRGILDAAMSVFTQRGYHAATIADIATAAGLGKGTLYLYFENKEAIAEAMVESHFQRLQARFIAQSVPDDLEGFLRTLEKAMDVPDDHAKFIRVFFEVFGPSFASDSFAATVSAFFEKLGTHYEHCLMRLKEQGAIRDEVDPKLLGRSLASLVDGMILHRGLFGLSKSRYSKMRGEVLQMMVKGVAAA